MPRRAGRARSPESAGVAQPLHGSMTARQVAAGEAFVPRFILLPRQGPIGHGEQVATMILLRSSRRYSFSRSGASAHRAGLGRSHAPLKRFGGEAIGDHVPAE